MDFAITSGRRRRSIRVVNCFYTIAFVLLSSLCETTGGSDQAENFEKNSKWICVNIHENRVMDWVFAPSCCRQTGMRLILSSFPIDKSGWKLTTVDRIKAREFTPFRHKRNNIRHHIRLSVSGTQTALSIHHSPRNKTKKEKRIK